MNDDISFVGKIVALIKGNTSQLLNEQEYYYLMFGCQNGEDIAIIKSITPDEVAYFLDCCWHLGIKQTGIYQLRFMKSYRKFGKPHEARR